MARFTLKHLLAFTLLVAFLSACAASSFWFGTSKLRVVDVNERLFGENNEMIEADSAILYSIPLRSDKIPDTNVRYKGPYCSNETRIPLSGISEFSTKDFSRFNNFTGMPAPVIRRYPECHYDLYCNGCDRPVRVTAEAAAFLVTTADGNGRGQVSFLQVVESEF